MKREYREGHIGLLRNESKSLCNSFTLFLCVEKILNKSINNKKQKT